MPNITIQKLISILLNRIKFIILVTLICAVGFFLFSKFFIAPMYSTSAMIFVQNYNTDEGGVNAEAKKIYSADISGSTSLANICVTLFQNSDEMTTLYDGCNVSMSAQNETFFITFSVSGSDPQKCANVANRLAEKSTEIFSTFFIYGQIGVIKEATVPASNYYPNNLQNGLYGLVVGLALSILISVLVELIDTTIKNDDDLQAMYELPVFAEIPDFDSFDR